SWSHRTAGRYSADRRILTRLKDIRMRSRRTTSSLAAIKMSLLPCQMKLKWYRRAPSRSRRGRALRLDGDREEGRESWRIINPKLYERFFLCVGKATGDDIFSCVEGGFFLFSCER